MAKRMLKEERHELVKAVAAEAPEGMVLAEFAVDNVMRIKFAHLKPKGNVVVVGGKNGQGKTSLLKAIGYLLQGKDDMPTNIIRAGQNTAFISGKIGPFTVTRLFTRVPPEKSTAGNYFHTRIKVTGPRGEEFPSPQILLNQLLSYLSFDPLGFVRMTAKEQCETVRAMAKFEVDIDALDAAQAADYAARREAQYEVDSLTNRFGVLAAPAEDLPAELIDVAALTAKLQGAANHNSVVAAAKAQKQQYETSALGWLEEARTLRAQAIGMLADATNIDGMIMEVTDAGHVRKPNKVSEVYEKAVAITIGEEVDTAELAAQIPAANERNAAIERKKTYVALEEELRVATEFWTVIDERMEARKEERAKAMQTAELPIEGLEIGDGELFFEGLPLAQASGAQQIRVSLAIGMANNPKLRVLRFMDGGWDMLDEDSQALVRGEIEKHGFQLWVEHVGKGDHVTVVMEDGEASGDDVEDAK